MRILLREEAHCLSTQAISISGGIQQCKQEVLSLKDLPQTIDAMQDHVVIWPYLRLRTPYLRHYPCSDEVSTVYVQVHLAS